MYSILNFFLNPARRKSGRRRRRISTVVLIGGVLAGLAGGLLATVVMFLSWQAARETAALPQPTPTALRTLTPGTKVLAAVRLPEEPPGDGSLALFYIERQARKGRTTPSPASRNWSREDPAPLRAIALLDDGSPVTLECGLETVFLGSQRIDLAVPEETEHQRRQVGYRPGQRLCVKGTWEGADRIRPEVLFAGGVEDYLAELDRRPGCSLFSGLGCGGLGVLLLALGLGLRLLGR